MTSPSSELIIPYPRFLAALNSCLFLYRLAQTQQYDQDGIIEIFRQYGDHLYAKGDHDSAIEQYIKTIGKLEASYVIRKVSAARLLPRLPV